MASRMVGGCSPTARGVSPIPCYGWLNGKLSSPSVALRTCGARLTRVISLASKPSWWRNAVNWFLGSQFDASLFD